MAGHYTANYAKPLRDASAEPVAAALVGQLPLLVFPAAFAKEWLGISLVFFAEKETISKIISLKYCVKFSAD
jgi:hypothetical protein